MFVFPELATAGLKFDKERRAVPERLVSCSDTPTSERPQTKQQICNPALMACPSPKCLVSQSPTLLSRHPVAPRPGTPSGHRAMGSLHGTLPCPAHRPCQQPDARSEGGWGSTGSAGRLSARSQCFPWNSVVRRRLYKCKEVGWAERNRLQLKIQRLPANATGEGGQQNPRVL